MQENWKRGAHMYKGGGTRAKSSSMSSSMRPLVSGMATKAKNAMKMDTTEKPIMPAAVSYPVASQILRRNALNRPLAAWHAVVNDDALPRARKGKSSAGTTQEMRPMEKA